MRRRVDAECLTTLGQGRVKIPIDGCIRTPKYIFFQHNTAQPSRIQNDIICDLFWTGHMSLLRKAPFIFKLVIARYDYSLTTNSRKFEYFDHCKSKTERT